MSQNPHLIISISGANYFPLLCLHKRHIKALSSKISTFVEDGVKDLPWAPYGNLEKTEAQQWNNLFLKGMIVCLKYISVCVFPLLSE